MRKNLASDAYEAYGDNRGWKTYDDKPMPQWEELPKEIQTAWEVAESKIFEALVSSLKLDEREMNIIHFSQNYKNSFSNAGVAGHNQILITAKLANALGIE